MNRERRKVLVCCIVWLLVWWVSNLYWLHLDRALPDGDEMGHIGAAELFLGWLGGGEWSTFLGQAWYGSLGEYPPLWPALLGFWWYLMGSPLPESVWVQQFPLVFPVVSAWVASRFALRLGPGKVGLPALTFALTLVLPLPVGIARSAMPEGPLMAFVNLSLLAMLWSSEAPRSILRWLLVGCCLGASLLVKQTAILFLWAPVLWYVRTLGVRSLVLLPLVFFIAGPWYVSQWANQLNYGGGSLEGNPEARVWDHVFALPGMLFWPALGPVFGLVLLWTLRETWAIGGLRGLFRGTPARGLLWLTVGFGLLTLLLIPRKYPRLLLPLLPLMVPLMVVALRHQRARLFGLVAAAGFLVMASVVDFPVARFRVDARCPQRWLRPFDSDDWGISAVVAWSARQAPAPLVLVAPPEIPCTVRTTFPWTEHLLPALRRSGQERPVEVLGAGESMPPGSLVLRFDPMGRPLPPEGGW